MDNRNNELSKMAIDSAENQFEVEHVRGVDNCDTDALSRIEIASLESDELANEQQNDDLLQQFRKKTPNSFGKMNNIWYFINDGLVRLCVPQSRVKEILRMCHDNINHIDQFKCLDIVYNRFYWP
ncbi:hypothetical protein BLA29_013738, partial [Euroglyphus maynei]